MHHLPENLDALFQEWLNRNVDPRRLTHESARDLLKRGFQAGFELHEVTEGRKRAAMNDLERQHADYPGGSDDYAPRAYRNPSQPPFFTATRDAYVPDTDGMPSHDTHFFPIPAFPGHERPKSPEIPSIPPLPPESGPRAPLETRFDYIDTVWAENDQG